MKKYCSSTVNVHRLLTELSVIMWEKYGVAITTKDPSATSEREEKSA